MLHFKGIPYLFCGINVYWEEIGGVSSVLLSHSEVGGVSAVLLSLSEVGGVSAVLSHSEVGGVSSVLSHSFSQDQQSLVHLVSSQHRFVSLPSPY